MSITLLPYQSKAADQIANRFNKLISDRDRPYVKASWPVPYYQALSALTGAGKTPILADAVSQIRGMVPVEPIILWISKAKAVVDQTFGNFQPGGKYDKFVEGFNICYLSELDREKIGDETVGWLALSTVASFNDKDRTGRLKAHRVNQDQDEVPLWPLLTTRNTSSGVRRPLVIVYDEGHNLTDQQTELLMTLEPDSILVASATMATPGKLGKMIDRLEDSGWTKEHQDDTDETIKSSLVTAIKSSKVVDAGLVKRQVVLAGYHTEMETCLGDLLDEMTSVQRKAKEFRAGFKPKAIYVCRTNISQDDGSSDNPHKPFVERKSPPILIWRYLVEQRGIRPETIAVYCDLKFDMKNYPPPLGFVHFSGGENDFSDFSKGDFEHIIFNLSLQEGWDDPSCCFAYIDKSMGSSVQIEQVIGRALRQPAARHFPDPDLNTANFYVRVDNKQEFPSILDTVRRKIAAEIPEIKLDGFSDPKDRRRAKVEPRAHKVAPEIHIDSSNAVDPIEESLKDLLDYRDDKINTIGKGELHRAIQTIGDGSDAIQQIIELEHSNRVTARWILRRAIQSMHPEPVKTIDWADARLDASIEITSRAATELRQKAEQLVDLWLEYSDLSFEESNPYRVGSVFVKPDKITNFCNSLHEGYSDLNPLELEIAKEIDSTGYVWVRNPQNGGFSIPLLTRGDTRNFFPDFLVWKDETLIVIDPKGAHLIATDAGRKLLDIRDEKHAKKVVVKLITEGKWSSSPVRKEGNSGYTVWSIGKGGVLKAHCCQTLKKTVEVSLKV